MLHEDDWLEVHPNEFVFPPIRQRQPGRPRVNRRRGEDEIVNTTRCSRCGIFGHNVRSCQNEEAGTVRARRRGRRSGRPRTRPISNTLHRPINPETEDLSSVMGRDNTRERTPSGRARRGWRRGSRSGRARGGRGGIPQHTTEMSFCESQPPPSLSQSQPTPPPSSSRGRRGGRASRACRARGVRGPWSS
ncbi:hypothetical protein IFM89_019578 [Coptis chinensis]|uniref:CCHC-type domain-containing protein n=1 Tax=Coptis chinensis TaxID=261450 RepID=A0A835IBR7_9MAGN|nr:hypothetical protein IFM89_019578 [Coptis chinensis]